MANGTSSSSTAAAAAAGDGSTAVHAAGTTGVGSEVPCTSAKPPICSSSSSGGGHHRHRHQHHSPSPARHASPASRRESPSRHRRSQSQGEPRSASESDAGEAVQFGRRYIIPKPFDERLLPEVAAAVVQAAIETGVARLADLDIKEYRRSLVDLCMRINM